MRSFSWLGLAFFAAAVPAACTLGCSGGGDEGEVVASEAQRDMKPSVSSADESALSAGNEAFAFDLYDGVVSGSSNAFYSPYSVSIALAMTYAGAGGDTATQMAKALHFTLPAPRLANAFDALDLELTSRGAASDPSFALHVADALWGDKTLAVQSSFLDTLAKNYGAGLRVSDFVHASEDAREDINSWVEDETDDKIVDLLPKGSVSPDTRFVLVNAIYFDAKWAHPFDANDTSKQPFTRADGKKVNVATMYQGASFRYASTSKYEAVELPYAGDKVVMDLLVPAAGQFSKVESELAGDLIEATGAMKSRELQIWLPKLHVAGQTVSLSDQLKRLGMVDAFEPGKADFSNMLKKADPDFHVSDVLQKAFVDVDEKGTVAAAATAVVEGDGAAFPSGKRVRIDHPFFFFIRDVPTNTILFVGRMMDPS